MSEPVQNFENHRFLPKWFVAQAVIAVAALLIMAVAVVQHEADWALMALGIGGILLGIAVSLMNLNLRFTGLKLQDRVIRLETQVRLYRILPADLHAHIPGLSVAQLCSIRFASDEELAGVVSAVVRDRITDRNTIKKMVKNWQADHMRV